YIYITFNVKLYGLPLPLDRGISGRVDLFQPYEQSEIGPIEDWGIIPATGLHLASVSEKQK
ncbi:hypothetical protein, partial [Klebsiella pneumoniae]|uniref:hypothetical protein n=1 Tax=Klebsiella pneumoniae TaxID=573 RepID=UPI001BA98A20